MPPNGKDVHAQITPESRHIRKQLQSTSYEVTILNLYLSYGTETQTALMVSYIGIQCELIVPPIITSIPAKAGIGAPKPNKYIDD